MQHSYVDNYSQKTRGGAEQYRVDIFGVGIGETGGGHELFLRLGFVRETGEIGAIKKGEKEKKGSHLNCGMDFINGIQGILKKAKLKKRKFRIFEEGFCNLIKINRKILHFIERRLAQETNPSDGGKNREAEK